MNIWDYLRYNKVSTGISGLDKIFFDGLVIPYERSKNLLIAIRGDNDKEKTAFTLQLIHSIGSTLKKKCDVDVTAHYFTETQKKSYVCDLELDLLISSAIRDMTRMSVCGKKYYGNEMTNTFFDTSSVFCHEYDTDYKFSLSQLKSNPDGLICEEALYYNTRTNSLHYRRGSRDVDSSDEKSAVYERKYDYLSNYIEKGGLEELSDLLNTVFVDTKIHECTERKPLDVKLLATMGYRIIGVNIGSKRRASKELDSLIDTIRKHSKVGILVLRDDMDIPEEKVDLIIDMSSSECDGCNYLINKIKVEKSQYQLFVKGTHQYKFRDYGIEVYPNIHLYCLQRRYLQRALVYTHSSVLTETFQQYLDNEEGKKSYDDYLAEIDDVTSGYLNALSPSAYKNFSVHQVLDSVFINPIKDKIS